MPAEAFPVRDPAELAFAGDIVRRLDQSVEIRKRFDVIHDRPIPIGSQLAMDDRATAWMQTSHVVATALTMATDNMRALDAMLRPAGELLVPMYAHYPILRSVLESGAEAKWLLDPDDRKERIRRLLRARFSDAKHDAELAKEQTDAVILSLGSSVDMELIGGQRRIDAERYAKHIAKIRDIAATQEIPWATIKGGLPPWIHLIRNVCTVPKSSVSEFIPGEYVATLWKIMSGLSHPSTSRSSRNSEVEELGESEDGIVHARLTASLRWSSAAVTAAFNTTLEAVALMELRSTRRG